MKAESEKEKDSKATLVGSPKAYEPDELKGAVLKCQQIKGEPGDSASGGPKEFTMTMCIWSDHSTMAIGARPSTSAPR